MNIYDKWLGYLLGVGSEKLVVIMNDFNIIF